MYSYSFIKECLGSFTIINNDTENILHIIKRSEKEPQ